MTTLSIQKLNMINSVNAVIGSLATVIELQLERQRGVQAFSQRG